MKKFLGAALAAIGLFGFMGCNDLQGDTDVYTGEYGSITVTGDRGISSSDVKSCKAVVTGYKSDGTTFSVSSDVTAVTNGTASLSISNIPVTKNAVVTVQGYSDASGTQAISGEEISNITDVSAKDNSVSVSWGTTSLGNIYKAVANLGIDTSKVNDSIKSAVSSLCSSFKANNVHALMVDADKIAQAIKSSGSIESAYTNYMKTAGKVIVTAYGYSGKKISISDPSSSEVNVTSDEVKVEIANVIPGTWNIYVDGEKIKTVKITSGDNNVTIGNPAAGKTIIFVKTTGNKIYTWGASSQVKYAGEWSGSSLSAVPDGYMNDSTGWLCYDITDKYDGDPINFIILNGETKLTDDVVSGKTGTFWWDGTDFYDADPTEIQISSDATLKSISVNGTSVGNVSSTVSYEIGSKVTSATVTAETNDSKASYVVSPSGAADIAEGASKTFTITVTAEDGTTKTYTVNVTRKEAVVDDVTLASVTVNGSAASGSGTSYTFSKKGSDDSLTISSVVATPNDSAATVTYSETPKSVSDGGSAAVTITVTNGSKSAAYTLTISYTKNSGGQTTGAYYGTNKTGYGVNKTISSFSDWSTDMIIAQGAANDDPRAFRGYHEKATDFYALYAAYDDTNLYLMVEMPSIDGRDLTSKDWQYALDENLGMGIGIDTGKRTTGNGLMTTNETPWGNGSVNWKIESGIDTIMMFHPAEYGTPCFLQTNSEGLFSWKENTTEWKAGGISTSKEVGLVSKTLYGRSSNYDLTETEYLAKTDYVDMLSDPEKSDVSGYMYQITIPLATLGVDKAYIESTGIGVMTFSTFGTSMMDALPWDSSLIDCAKEAYSKDDSTSAEKEDVDEYTSALARVGHM